MEEQSPPNKDYNILKRLARMKCAQKNVQREIRRIRESHPMPKKEQEELLQRLRALDAELAVSRATLLRLMEENKELRALQQEYQTLQDKLKDMQGHIQPEKGAPK